MGNNELAEKKAPKISQPISERQSCKNRGLTLDLKYYSALGRWALNFSMLD